MSVSAGTRPGTATSTNSSVAGGGGGAGSRNSTVAGGGGSGGGGGGGGGASNGNGAGGGGGTTLTSPVAGSSASTGGFTTVGGNGSSAGVVGRKRNLSIAGFDSSPGSTEDIDEADAQEERRRTPVKRACNECRQQKVRIIVPGGGIGMRIVSQLLTGYH